MAKLSLNSSKKTKQTAAGEIPVDWESAKLGDYLTIKHGFAFDSKWFGRKGEYILLTPGSYYEQGGYRDQGNNTKYYTGDIPKEYILSDGDLLLAMTEQAEGLLGSALKVPKRGKFLHNQRLGLVSAKKQNSIILDYVFWLYNWPKTRRLISTTSSGTKVHHTSPSRLLDIDIPLPPLPEQGKIADILSTWDEALEKLDALIAAKDRRKQALMQQLLTGKMRVKGFNKPWKKFRFQELLKPEDRYVEFDDEHSYRLVSIRRRSGGVFFREELQGCDIKTKVMKFVQTYDFLISRMQVVHGALGMVRPQCNGMYASDSYDVLVAKDANILHMPFLDWMSRLRSFWNLTYISSHGVHIEKMTFKLSDFMHEKIAIPADLAEQRQIAAILDTADHELTLLRTQRNALDQQKRGLMQRLLTGKIRV